MMVNDHLLQVFLCPGQESTGWTSANLLLTKTTTTTLNRKRARKSTEPKLFAQVAKVNDPIKSSHVGR